MAVFFQHLGCDHAHPEFHYPFTFFETSLRGALTADANLNKDGGAVPPLTFLTFVLASLASSPPSPGFSLTLGWAAGGAVVPPVECGTDTWDARVPWGNCSGSNGHAFQETYVTQMYQKGASILRMLQLYLEKTAHCKCNFTSGQENLRSYFLVSEIACL